MDGLLVSMVQVAVAVLEHSAALLLVFPQLLLMHAAIHCSSQRAQALQRVMYSNKSVTDCALLLAQRKHVSVCMQPQARFEHQWYLGRQYAA